MPFRVLCVIRSWLQRHWWLIVHYCLFNHLLWGHRVTVNMTARFVNMVWCSFVVKCGNTQKSDNPCFGEIVRCSAHGCSFASTTVQVTLRTWDPLNEAITNPEWINVGTILITSFQYFSVCRTSESGPVHSPWPGYETTIVHAAYTRQATTIKRNGRFD